MVDENIYERRDVCLCNIINIIYDDRNILRVGNKLEFDIGDIVEVKNYDTGDVLFECA